MCMMLVEASAAKFAPLTNIGGLLTWLIADICCNPTLFSTFFLTISKGRGKKRRIDHWMEHFFLFLWNKSWFAGLFSGELPSGQYRLWAWKLKEILSLGLWMGGWVWPRGQWRTSLPSLVSRARKKRRKTWKPLYTSSKQRFIAIKTRMLLRTKYLSAPPWTPPPWTWAWRSWRTSTWRTASPRPPPPWPSASRPSSSRSRPSTSSRSEDRNDFHAEQ